MKKQAVIEFEASKGSSEPVKAEVEMELVEVPDYSELANGNYKLSVTDGVATWVEVIELPDHSELANGDYKLTMVDGTATWELIV